MWGSFGAPTCYAKNKNKATGPILIVIGITPIGFPENKTQKRAEVGPCPNQEQESQEKEIMATYWVATSGDNSDGLTLATAKNAVPDGLALLSSKGDILNIVNDGTYTWPTSSTSFTSGAGTSWTDYGFLIRGVDSSENPAKVMLAATGGDGTRHMMSLLSGSGYVIVENLIFDATAKVSDTSQYRVSSSTLSGPPGPVQFRHCELLGAASGSMSSGDRSFYDNTSSNGGGLYYQYCYFQNCKSPGGSPGHSLAPHYAIIENCVGIWDVAGRGAAWFRPGNITANASNLHQFLNNTIYEDAGSGLSVDLCQCNQIASGDVGTVDSYSNLVWRNTTGGANTVQEFWSGGTSGATNAGTLGYNVLLGGPDVDGSELKSTGWYEIPWDANDDDSSGLDYYATDTVFYEKADTDVFNDPSSTYDWELPNGLITTILKDLRPKQYQFSGFGGNTPGALPVAPLAETPPTDDPADPNDPASIPYVSVFPFFADVWKISMNVRMSTSQNRKQKFYLRRDTEEQSMREFASRRIQTPASSTKSIITGLESAEFIFLESENSVQLSVDGTVFLPGATSVFVAGGAYSSLKVKNASVTDAANTLISVVD